MLDYTSEDLTGRSLYTLCHGADAYLLRKAHVDREWMNMLTLFLLPRHGVSIALPQSSPSSFAALPKLFRSSSKALPQPSPSLSTVLPQLFHGPYTALPQPSRSPSAVSQPAGKPARQRLSVWLRC